jgi:hypothetical protein
MDVSNMLTIFNPSSITVFVPLIKLFNIGANLEDSNEKQRIVLKVVQQHLSDTNENN